MASKLTHPVPVWVTRQTADGMIGSFTLALGLVLLLGLLIVLNLLAWSIIGLVEVVEYVL